MHCIRLLRIFAGRPTTASQRPPAPTADASRQSYRTHRSRRRSNPPRRQDIRNPARLRGIQGLVGVPRREDGAGRDAAAGPGARNTRGAGHRHQRRQPDPHGGMGLPQFSPHHALLLVHPRLPRTAPARARSRQMALQGRPPLRPLAPRRRRNPAGHPRRTLNLLFHQIGDQAQYCQLINIQLIASS